MDRFAWAYGWFRWTLLRPCGALAGRSNAKFHLYTAIRGAGFDVIEDATNKFQNHARITHPGGADGFSDEGLKGLSEALGKTKGCP